MRPYGCFSTDFIKYQSRTYPLLSLQPHHLTLGALQVAGDAGMLGPVQHGADFLSQF